MGDRPNLQYGRIVSITAYDLLMLERKIEELRKQNQDLREEISQLQFRLQGVEGK